jgi:hypothetical protein
VPSAAREFGKQLFHDLAPDFLQREHVDQTTMFGSEALRLRGKVFAFVGREGALVVKLPAERAADLVEAGDATWVRIGRNQAREWVGVALPSSGATDAWCALVDESHAFLASLSEDCR